MKHKEKRKHLEKKFLRRPLKKSRDTRVKLDLQDAPQDGALVLAPTQDLELRLTSSSSSEDFLEDKFLEAELCNSPEDAPKSQEVISSSHLEAGENLSASEHLPCVSSSSKYILVDDDGPGSSRMLLNQDLMEWENPSFMPHSGLPSSSTNNRSVSAVSTEEKRVMNVYYKPAPTKRSVAALEETEEDLEPPAKMIRIGKIVHPEGIPPKASLPRVYLGNILTDGDDGLDRKGQKEREEAEKPPETLPQVPGPSTKTPAVLEDMYSGFRCMGCCRVFPNLRMLKKHLERGAEDGVSCIDLAFAKLRSKRKESKRMTRKENKTTSGGGMDIFLRFLLILALCSFLFYYYNE